MRAPQLHLRGPTGQPPSTLSIIVQVPGRPCLFLAPAGPSRRATSCAAAEVRPSSESSFHSWEDRARAGGGGVHSSPPSTSSTSHDTTANARGSRHGPRTKPASTADNSSGERLDARKWVDRDRVREPAGGRTQHTSRPGGSTPWSKRAPGSRAESGHAEPARLHNKQAPQGTPSADAAALRRLAGARDASELCALLRDQPGAAATPLGLATAWTRLGNLRVGSGHGDAAAEAAAGTATRQLLEGAAAVAGAGGAEGMQMRHVANVMWGMAKTKMDPKKDPAAKQALQRLQERLSSLLQEKHTATAPKAPSATAGNASRKGGDTAVAVLDIRDAAQLWYAFSQLPFSWNPNLVSALVDATLHGMESGAWTAAPADAVSAAQVAYRVGLLGPASLRQPSQRERLAAAIASLASRPPQQVPNPDCLLGAAHLLKLDLPRPTLAALHDAALAIAPAAAARMGRTALARALHSAVQMGLHLSADEGVRWERRLTGREFPAGWQPAELSWTLLALSSVRAYAPDAEAREVFRRAMGVVIRQATANDATRMHVACAAWEMWLPPREQTLLNRKAGKA